MDAPAPRFRVCGRKRRRRAVTSDARDKTVANDNDKELVAFFMPPLATMLAHAEKAKGSPLTASEVERVRDSAVGIMVKTAVAEAMVQSRGYRDVNPTTCWSNWHRLRSEMIGGYLPEIVLCLVGAKDFPQRAQPLLDELGLKHEFREYDPLMSRAFVASDARGRIANDELDRIAGHERVL
jgi:hypothetical protein